MASTDARPFPLKNTAYRVTFPILDADGDLVTGASSPDSEISKDSGTFTDCTNEATEIATSSGVYYLDLTSTEMNADTVAIIVKCGTAGAKTTTIVLYPVEAGDIDVDVTAWNGTAVATPDTAGYPKVTLKSGTGTGEVNLSSGRADANATYIAGAAVSTSTAQLGVNVVNAGGTAWGSGAITAGVIAADAIGASELAADAATEIGTAVWATAARTLTAATNVTSTGAAVPITAGGLVSADVTAISTDATAANNAESFFDGTGYAGTNNVIPTVTTTATATAVTTVNGLAAGVITAASIATDAIDSDAIAASAVTEIQSGLATAAALATVDGIVDDILVDTGTTLPGSIAALNDLSAADVNAQVVDALATDTYAEPGSVPAATSSLKDKINWLFMLARNARTTTASADKVRNDANSSDVATAALSDDGTTFTRGEYA